MIETISNHVFFPHTANASERVKRKLSWETVISEAVTGSQSRFAFRTVARLTISFLVTPWSLQEQAQLDDRIVAARASGLACAPFWCRPSLLQEECNSPELTLQAVTRSWKIGDVVFFSDETPGTENFDYRSIVAVDGVNITLDDAPAATWPAGAKVWPLVFGKFSCEQMTARHNEAGRVRLTIAEQRSPLSAAVGAIAPDDGVGVGHGKIGTTFNVG